MKIGNNRFTSQIIRVRKALSTRVCLYRNGHIECAKTTTPKYFDIQCTSTFDTHFVRDNKIKLVKLVLARAGFNLDSACAIGINSKVTKLWMV